jgi:hypothetical protein
MVINYKKRIMLSKKIKNYLKEEEEIRLLPDYQKKFKQIMESYGIKSSSFIELMSTYAGEFSGSEGTMINVAEDLSNENKSYILSLQKSHNLDKKYLQLLSSEYDDYLLYNIEDDTVVLIEGMNDEKLKEKSFDEKWPSFNGFLNDFFDID